MSTSGPNYARVATESPAKDKVTIGAAYRRVAVELSYLIGTSAEPPARPMAGFPQTNGTTLAAVAGPGFVSPTPNNPAPTESPVVSLGRLVVPLAEQPGRYPFDWYASTGLATVALGSPAVGVPGPTGGLAQGFAYDVTLFRAPEVNPLLRLSARVGVGTAIGDAISFRFTRSVTTQVYVVVVALIPLVLATILLVILFVPRASSHRAGRDETLIGVAAATLLAVLPIRFVLVPSSVTELTMVDYLLGFEMAVLAAVACLAARNAVSQ